MAELSPQWGSGWGSTQRAELLFSPESQSSHDLLPHISHHHTCNTCQYNLHLLEARPGPFHLPGTDWISAAWSASCLFLTIKLIFQNKTFTPALSQFLSHLNKHKTQRNGLCWHCLCAIMLILLFNCYF